MFGSSLKLWMVLKNYHCFFLSKNGGRTGQIVGAGMRCHLEGRKGDGELLGSRPPVLQAAPQPTVTQPQRNISKKVTGAVVK